MKAQVLTKASGLVLLALLLVHCGQKGPLYIQQEVKAEGQKTAVEKPSSPVEDSKQ